MSAFRRLVVKELRELARPRYLVPLVMAPLFLVVAMQGMGSVQDGADEPMAVAVVDNDGGEYARLAVETLGESANVTAESSGTDPEGALDAVRDGPAEVLLVVPDGFTERIEAGERAQLAAYSAIDEVSYAGATRTARTDALVETVNERLAGEITGATPQSLEPVEAGHATYVRGTRVDASPAALSNAVSSRFFLLAMAMVFAIFGAGQLMIQGMSSEKENKTLETLLTMPVKRRTIAAAKLTSSAILGLGLGALYTAAIYLARPSNLGGAEAIPQLAGTDYLLVGVLLALAIVDVLALALWLGVFADDSRGAQTLMVPIVFGTMAPAFVVQFFGVSSLSLPLKAALFAIPSTYPVLAPQRLLFGDTGVVVAGLVYQTAFAVAMIWLAVRLFDSDRLVTGDTGRLGAVVERLQR
ncbi:ABC transporter permease [Halorussus halobius]|uniref:ABC transporter permease n=1 Tax=Halorussus halobius TaxID=1710537 RepID=UPI001092B5C8|nr:ABC transporter permease [Halorussus halobius]